MYPLVNVVPYSVTKPQYGWELIRFMARHRELELQPILFSLAQWLNELSHGGNLELICTSFSVLGKKNWSTTNPNYSSVTPWSPEQVMQSSALFALPPSVIVPPRLLHWPAVCLVVCNIWYKNGICVVLMARLPFTFLQSNVVELPLCWLIAVGARPLSSFLDCWSVNLVELMDGAELTQNSFDLDNPLS